MTDSASDSAAAPATPSTGLYLDDLQVGQRFVSGPYAMTAERIIAFARDYDPQPFHLSDDAARQSLFGGLAASGWHTAAVSMRLFVECLPLAEGIIGGGMDEFAWPRPTRPGDELHLEVEVTEIVPSRSRPGRAMVKFLNKTLNQRGEVVQITRPNLVVHRRPEATG